MAVGLLSDERLPSVGRQESVRRRCSAGRLGESEIAVGELDVADDEMDVAEVGVEERKKGESEDGEAEESDGGGGGTEESWPRPKEPTMRERREGDSMGPEA